MTISSFLNQVYHKDKLLFRIGLFFFILFVLLFIPLSIDNRLVQGINPWIKPMKFCLSLGIYLWTIAWLLDYLKAYKRWKVSLSAVIGISLAIEMFIILFQGGRGLQSHFNVSTSLNAMLFQTMGIMIALSTISTFIMLILFFIKKINLDKVYLNSIRIGIAVFLAASYIGGVMIGNMAHAVGVEDGGHGLPFLNWSTEGGDLRAAHFFGLHALQIFPIVTHLFMTKTNLDIRNRMLILLALTLVFVSVLGYLFTEAMNGYPLVSI